MSIYALFVHVLTTDNKIYFRPGYACRSDPRNLSTLVDPHYVPGVRGEHEFLGLIPNVYNPAIPLPLSLTPEETMAIYDVLYQMRSQKKQPTQEAEKEEHALYEGSINPIPPDWY